VLPSARRLLCASQQLSSMRNLTTLKTTESDSSVTPIKPTITEMTKASDLSKKELLDAEDRVNEEDDDDDNEYEEMFVETSFGDVEWGGPLRGGRYPEPTRHGDWHQKGRCTDFE